MELTADLIKLHNQALHISYFFTNIGGMIKFEGHHTDIVCSMYGLWWGITKTKKENLKTRT